MFQPDRSPDFGLLTDRGRVIEHVSNPEAMAVAALIYETDGQDLLWCIYMAHALFFEWEEWERRDPSLPKKKLEWGGETITSSSTSRLVRRALGHLTPADVLPLDGRRLSDDGVLWLTEALVIRRDLNTVDLSFNNLSATSVKYLCDCFANSSLEALYLGNNVIADVGAEAVASLLRENPNIKRLNLSRNGLSNDGILHIAKAMAASCDNSSSGNSTAGVRRRKLKMLQLSFTNNPNITEDGIAAFLDILLHKEVQSTQEPSSSPSTTEEEGTTTAVDDEEGSSSDYSLATRLGQPALDFRGCTVDPAAIPLLKSKSLDPSLLLLPEEQGHGSGNAKASLFVNHGCWFPTEPTTNVTKVTTATVCPKLCGNDRPGDDSDCDSDTSFGLGGLF